MKAILVERSGRLNDARQWLVILLLTVTSLVGVAVASGAQSVEVDARGNWSVRAPAPEPWRQAAGSRAQAEHEGDRAALIELYNATDGANWTNATNWNSSAPIVEWYGVSTDDDGRVSRLSLNRNNLTGSIPPSLGNLANLERLHLYQNNLTGSIPPSLGNLANLERLNLSQNNLTGSIPPSLGNLANLERLHLYQNNLTGSIPPSLGNLANLEWLGLFENNLTGSIPPSLGNLANLEWLGLYRNNLTGSIPPSLGNLANLDLLGLYENDLTGSVPPSLGDLTNLLSLNIHRNKLTGPLPSLFVNLSILQYLTIYDNAGLCAPADVAFQTWLATVRYFEGDTCAAVVPVAPPLAHMLLGLFLLSSGVYWRRRPRA